MILTQLSKDTENFRHNKGDYMLRKLLETLPFVTSSTAINYALRKAVVMSLQRPINIKQIETYVLSKYVNNPLRQLKIYLMESFTCEKEILQERFFKPFCCRIESDLVLMNQTLELSLV